MPLKTEASRRVLALDTTTVAILRLHRHAQEDYCRGHGLVPSGYVFTGADGGPLSPEYLTRTFARLIKETGLPPVRLQDLRHGAASLALAAGADLKVIADQPQRHPESHPARQHPLYPAESKTWKTLTRRASRAARMPETPQKQAVQPAK